MFIRDEFVQESLKEVFKRLLLEEIKFTLHKAGSDKASFIKYLKEKQENELMTYEKLCMIKNEFSAFSTEDTKWYNAVVTVIKN